MGLIQDSDVERLMADPEMMQEVVAGLVSDSPTMDTLAEDIADKVQDALEDDSELRRRLVDAAVSNDVFKRKLIANSLTSSSRSG